MQFLGGLWSKFPPPLDPHGRILHLKQFARSDVRRAQWEAIRNVRWPFSRPNYRSPLFDGRLSDNILQSMWEKWVFIAAAAGIHLPPARLGRRHPGSRWSGTSARQIYEECAQIRSGTPDSPPSALDGAKPALTLLDGRRDPR